MKKTITVQVDEKMYNELSQMAKKEERTLAAEIRRIVKEYFNSQNEASTENL